MPPNLEARLARNRHTWRDGQGWTYARLPTLSRCFAALVKLTERDLCAEYDGQSGGAYWVRFRSAPGASDTPSNRPG